MINESYTCKRINKLIELNELTSENLMIIINDNSSKELKNICNLTLSRINEIIKGSCPSLLECILIGQALSKGFILGAIVYFDKDKKYCYEVFDLVIDTDLNLAARLKDKGSQMSWRSDNDRLHVIGFHEHRKSYSNTI